MNYAKIKWFDIANGPGVRASLFVSGCTHKCPGCFNEEAQDFNYGNPWTKEIENKFIEHLKKPEIVGVNILGGEPLQQGQPMLDLIDRIEKEVNKPIWLWTGYTLEEINKQLTPQDALINDRSIIIWNCIIQCSVVIDGKFDESLKDITLKYRGSSNQRVIDIKASLENSAKIYGHGILNEETIVELEGC